MENNKILLAWELPQIQEYLQKLSNTTVDKIEERIKNRSLSDEEITAILLYKTWNAAPNDYWDRPPAIPEGKKHLYWDRFKNHFLVRYDLFRRLPKGNKKVELIFIHAFIPHIHIESYLDVLYKYYSKDEYIDLKNEEIKESFKSISATVNYILEYEKLSEKFESISNNIIDIWNENTDIFKGPFWFYKKIIEFKKNKNIQANLKRKFIWRDPSTGRFYINEKFSRDIAFISRDFKYIHYKEEDHHIYLSSPAFYIILRKEIKDISFDNFEEYIPKNNDNYKIFKIRDPRLLEGETINNKSIIIYSDASKYFDVDGKVANYVISEDPVAKVFYEEFTIHTKEKFVSYVLELPNGEIKLKEEIENTVFNEEGVYKILYEVVSEERNIAIKDVLIYLLKENPQLVKKNLTIRYKGKEYASGDYLDTPEFKGKGLKFSLARIEYLKPVIDSGLEYKIEISGRKNVPGLFLTIENRCGKQIDYLSNLPQEFKIDLNQYPEKYINFPIVLNLMTKIVKKDYKTGRERNHYVLLDKKIVKGPYKKPCAYKILLKDILRVTLGRSKQKHVYELDSSPFITYKEKNFLSKILYRFGYKISPDTQSKIMLEELEEILNNLNDYKNNQLKELMKLKSIINRNFFWREIR